MYVTIYAIRLFENIYSTLFFYLSTSEYFFTKCEFIDQHNNEILFRSRYKRNMQSHGPVKTLSNFFRTINCINVLGGLYYSRFLHLYFSQKMLFLQKFIYFIFKIIKKYLFAVYT